MGIIRFSKNGGVGEMPMAETSGTLPKNDIKRFGYEFKGWARCKNGEIDMKRFQLGKVEYEDCDNVNIKDSGIALPDRGYFAKKDKGYEVKVLQTYLKNEGFYIGKITGKYKDIVNAVKDFQKFNGLTNDGLFGEDCLSHVSGNITLYPVWRGCGIQAAADWAKRIAKDNSFMYGVGERAHHSGCYFCGTNVTGAKHAKKGSKWEKTYCCNPFVYAALTHGANFFKKCKSSSLKSDWWCKLKVDNKAIYKKGDKNASVSKLKAGDLLIKEGKHIVIVVGKNKDGVMQIAHAAGEGWAKKSIRVQSVSGRIGSKYRHLKYIGKK